MIFKEKKALVIAPHPDDEVLGVGGVISRLSNEGWSVTVAVITKAMPPLFSEEFVKQGREEALRAHSLLGVSSTIFLDDFPAAQLDTIEHSRINHSIREIIINEEPAILFIPFIGDIHNDHYEIFKSCMVASRPNGGAYPAKILAYETLSETNWNAPFVTPAFIPNVFFDISEHIDKKIEAMNIFRSQIKQYPNERSSEAIKALAIHRGTTVHIPYAEAFILIREVFNGKICFLP